MSLIAWIAFGLLVGLAARWIVPGAMPGGIALDAALGIAGAVGGGWLYGAFDHTGIAGLNLASFACALIGAVVLLWIARSITGRGDAA